MHHYTSPNKYLFAFDHDRELSRSSILDPKQWVRLKLGTEVSPLTVGTGNTILKQDGILAFIGTRSEFGAHLFQLARETSEDSRRLWVSSPVSILFATLGLRLSTSKSGRREIVFYGSPLVLALAYRTFLLASSQKDLLDSFSRRMQNSGVVPLEDDHFAMYYPVKDDQYVCRQEWEEAARRCSLLATSTSVDWEWVENSIPLLAS